MPLMPPMTKRQFADETKRVKVTIPGLDDPVELEPYVDVTGCGWKGTALTVVKVGDRIQQVRVKISVACTTSKNWSY